MRGGGHDYALVFALIRWLRISKYVALGDSDHLACRSLFLSDTIVFSILDEKATGVAFIYFTQVLLLQEMSFCLSLLYYLHIET